MKDFSSLCTPAKLYFVITVISSVFTLFNGVSIFAVIVQLLFAFIWTFLLSFLCDRGLKLISWGLVLLPYIFIALAMFNIYKK